MRQFHPFVLGSIFLKIIYLHFYLVCLIEGGQGDMKKTGASH